MGSSPSNLFGNGKGRCRSSLQAHSVDKMDKRLALIAMAIFSLGCVCDHLTTAYGLTLPNITELNNSVVLLNEYGVWHVIELLVIATGLCSGLFIIRLKPCAITKLSTIALMSGGFIRFSAGLQNLTTILNTLT